MFAPLVGLASVLTGIPDGFGEGLGGGVGLTRFCLIKGVGRGGGGGGGRHLGCDSVLTKAALSAVTSSSSILTLSANGKLLCSKFVSTVGETGGPKYSHLNAKKLRRWDIAYFYLLI